MPNNKLSNFFGYSGGQEFSNFAFFPYIDHINLNTMMLADNSLLAVIQMPGVPFTTVMNTDRNGFKHRSTAFLNATADDNVEVHIHLIKHDATLPPRNDGMATAPYARMLLEDYHASIQQDLAVLDWYLTVRVKPRKNPFASLTDKVRDSLAAIGVMARSTKADPQLEVQLEDAMRLALATLAPFGPVRLGTRFEGDGLAFSEIAEFLYLIRTTQFSPQPMANVLGCLGAGVAAVDVTAMPQARMLRIDHAAGGGPDSQTYAAVLGMVTYPQRLHQGRMDDLLKMPGRFVLTVAIRFQSRAEAQDSLDLLKRRLISGNSRSTTDTNALSDAIDQVAGGRAESGISRWSLVVHASTPPEVDQLVSAARTIVANAGAKIGVERAAMLNSYMAQLPGAPLLTWVRPARCTTKQIAVLASLSGYARGPARARWDHHLFRLISPGGTAYDHDLFVGDVGHSFIVGPNGGGKSVWLGMNIAALDSLVRKKNGTQIILDVDESNHNTVVMLGGRYSTIEVGRSGLAPLRGLPDTPRVRSFLRDLIAGLIQSDGTAAPTKTERDGIRAGVDFVMGEMEPHERSFAAIRNFMGFEENSAGERLEPWCQGGEVGWVFDGTEHTIDFNQRLVGVDLTAVMNDGRIMPALASMLLWMASDVMDGRRIVVWCEEAPAYMPTPAFSKPFKGIALRARKRNASFNAIAQQPSDMLENEAGIALIKQSRQFILFRNDKAIESDYRLGMGLTQAEFETITDKMFSVAYHTVLIKRLDGQSGMNKFDLSSLPQHLGILSGTPSRVRLLKNCFERNGGDEIKAFTEYQHRLHETAA